MSEERKEKFTPGAWHYEISKPWQSCGKTVFACDVFDSTPEQGYITGVCVDNPDWKANAALIAAAPEMYDFVKAFTTIGGQSLLLLADNGKEIYDSACQIMKKARGEL